MATDFNTLTVLRKNFSKVASDTEAFLKQTKEQLKEKELTLMSNVSDLMSSGNSGHDVAEKTANMTMINALSAIHHAMAVYQRLIAKINIDILPAVSSSYNDAKSTLAMEKTIAMNDEMMNRYLTSNAQRENEVSFIFIKSTKLMSDIDTANKSINSLIKFVEEQTSYLNRLDSAIRLKFNIKSRGDFIDESTAGVTGNVGVRAQDVEM